MTSCVMITLLKEPLTYNYEYCQPVRHLKILPGKPDTPIGCELFNSHIRIVDEPQIATSKSELFRSRLGRAPHNIAYSALFYVWGNAEDRVTIRVNRKDFLITRNLWIFLDRHRRSFTSRWKNRQFFWIDAICIDQGNVEERSKQVAFMADIYREAKMVLVWLEEGDSESHLAFETIKERGLNLRRSEGSCLAELSIFQEGYWDRLWIVQEILQARRITVRCSTFEVDWELLIKAIHGDVEAPPLDLNGIKKNSRDDRGYNMLCMFGSKKCSDPRDVMYALRSLAPSLMTFVPDYYLSTADVFTAVTRASIKDPDCLTFLDRLMHNKLRDPSIARIHGLPSWVPDWTMGYEEYRRLPPPWLHYSAGSGASKNHAHLLTHPNPRILHLKGIPVDTVTYATEPFLWQREEYTSVEKAKKLLQDWLPGCETSFRKLWDLKTAYGGWVYMLLTLDGLLKECDRQRDLDIPMPASETKFSSSEWQPISLLVGNTIVITKNGYRGFVLGTPKVNDLVFVAYGARYPYVLRQADGNEK